MKVSMVIPGERLPPGFAQRIGEAPLAPTVPQPAATAVLMRDSGGGIEVLLLKRLRSSGFVPGAYVFAGGRVDAEDGAEFFRESAGARTPSRDYWVAAIREVFEESGVLLARDSHGVDAHELYETAALNSERERLMAGTASMQSVMAALDLVPDYEAMAYAAHWITPLAESRRYDTRFFYAALPPGAVASADAREMSDAVWLAPRDALDRFQSGRLPMVFPTVRTLEDLLAFGCVADAMSFVRRTEIKPILPSLVRVGDGVGIVIDADE
jgi:8-oxo-dGTP pyrophosphatase MutT (NUDIX family)